MESQSVNVEIAQALYRLYVDAVTVAAELRYFPVTEGQHIGVVEVLGYEYGETRGDDVGTCIVPLLVDARLRWLDTGESLEQSVHLCDIPWVTESGVLLVAGETYPVPQLADQIGEYVDDLFRRWSYVARGALELADRDRLIPWETAPRVDAFSPREEFEKDF